MSKIAFGMVNTPRGLHNGHRAVIAFGKEFGEVTVQPAEDMLRRDQYLRRGVGTPRYTVDLSALKHDCDLLAVQLKKPIYISVAENTRVSLFNKVSALVNTYKEVLLCERYIHQAISSIMYSRLGEFEKYDLSVSGPEVLSFFYKRIGSLFNWTERKIYPQIVKDEDGLKVSSSSGETPFDRKSLRKVITEATDKYKVGSNDELVAELNYSYPVSVGWRVHEILVYEGGFVSGRIEVTSFLYQSSTGDWPLLEEVDYYV